MKRFVLILGSVLWLAVAAVFIIALVNPNFSIFGAGDMFVFSYETELIKEETASLAGIENLKIDSSSAQIVFSKGNSDELMVTQMGSKRHTTEFSLTRNGDTLSIDAKNKNVVRIGFFFAEEKLMVELPRDWKGSVDADNSSGGVRFRDSLDLRNLSIETSSGGISFDQSVSAENISLRCSSGGIKLLGDVSSNDELTLFTRSGGIKAMGNLSAGELDVNSSSGGINLNGSNDVSSFRIGCSSGGIDVGRLSGSGSIKTSSGGVRVEVGGNISDISVETSSGGITVRVPEELSFTFDGKVSSGSISSDYDLAYSGRQGKEASVRVGENPSAYIKCSASSGSIRLKTSQ